MQAVQALLCAFDGGNPGSGTAQASLLASDAAFRQVLRNRYDVELVLREPAVIWQGESEAMVSAYFQAIHDAVCVWQRHHQPNQPPLLVLGGDHGIAIGSWSGLLDSLPENETLGLLWLDAHLDAHTYISSVSGHLHGMPVAALLGLPDHTLQALYPGRRQFTATQIEIHGVRSYEAAEQQHVDSSGLAWYRHHRAEKVSEITRAITSAFHRLAAKCTWVGVSLDLDVFDPIRVPGVATPVAHGWPLEPVLEVLTKLRHHPQWLQFEIAEYCPPRDQGGQTQQALAALIGAVYGNPKSLRT